MTHDDATSATPESIAEITGLLGTLDTPQMPADVRRHIEEAIAAESGPAAFVPRHDEGEDAGTVAAGPALAPVITIPSARTAGDSAATHGRAGTWSRGWIGAAAAVFVVLLGITVVPGLVQTDEEPAPLAQVETQSAAGPTQQDLAAVMVSSGRTYLADDVDRKALDLVEQVEQTQAAASPGDQQGTSAADSDTAPDTSMVQPEDGAGSAEAEEAAGASQDPPVRAESDTQSSDPGEDVEPPASPTAPNGSQGTTPDDPSSPDDRSQAAALAQALGVSEQVAQDSIQCVMSMEWSGHTPLAIDIASYEGDPALVVVRATGVDGVVDVLVQRTSECTTAQTSITPAPSPPPSP